MVFDSDDDGDGVPDTEDISPLNAQIPSPLVWDAGDWDKVKWQ